MTFLRAWRPPHANHAGRRQASIPGAKRKHSSQSRSLILARNSKARPGSCCTCTKGSAALLCSGANTSRWLGKQFRHLTSQYGGTLHQCIQIIASLEMHTCRNFEKRPNVTPCPSTVLTSALFEFAASFLSIVMSLKCPFLLMTQKLLALEACCGRHAVAVSAFRFAAAGLHQATSLTLTLVLSTSCKCHLPVAKFLRHNLSTKKAW